MNVEIVKKEITTTALQFGDVAIQISSDGDTQHIAETLKAALEHQKLKSLFLEIKNRVDHNDLKAIREALGVSKIRDMAKHYGLSEHSYYELEQGGRRKPSPQVSIIAHRIVRDGL